MYVVLLAPDQKSAPAAGDSYLKLMEILRKHFPELKTDPPKRQDRPARLAEDDWESEPDVTGWWTRTNRNPWYVEAEHWGP